MLAQTLVLLPAFWPWEAIFVWKCFKTWVFTRPLRNITFCCWLQQWSISDRRRSETVFQTQTISDRRRPDTMFWRRNNSKRRRSVTVVQTQSIPIDDDRKQHFKHEVFPIDDDRKQYLLATKYFRSSSIGNWNSKICYIKHLNYCFLIFFCAFF